MNPWITTTHDMNEKNKEKPIFLNSFLHKLGPGLITGASDDDPSGILTYLQAGAIQGFQSLWTALFTLPLMFGIQEMAGRIGMVTRKGLITLIKERYSRISLFFIAFISIFVITLNIGADLLAMSVSFEKIFYIPQSFAIVLLTSAIIFGTILLPYHKFIRIMKWLSFSLLFYVISALYLHINLWEALINTVTPSIKFDKNFIFILSAVIGTTISPYLFVWQADEEVEEETDDKVQRKIKRFTITKNELKIMRHDTFAGMFFSNIVMWFIMAGSAQIAATFHTGALQSYSDGARVLAPIFGNFAFIVFSLGIVGTGILAIPILAGSVGYMISEIFNWRKGIDKTFREAPGFYLSIVAATLIGFFITMLNFNPITLLIWTAVLYAIITPPLIVTILKIANDEKLLRNKINSSISNLLGVLTLVVTSTIAILLIGLFFHFNW